ncbi:MAG TPA: hypothetical protein VF511_10050 [Chthoniobacterales bacterium]
MATPRQTQKEISERYQDNLTQYQARDPWRVARFIASFLLLAGGLGFIIAYQNRVVRGEANEEFFNTGPLSSHHAHLEKGCSDCHDKTATSGADLSPGNFKNVIKARFQHGLDFHAIDVNCQECHEKHPPFGTKKKYDLHEPNVVDNRACSICHQEHLGAGPMKRVAGSQCATCHNDPRIMEASGKKGMTLPPAAFHLRPDPPQQNVFELPRPKNGYTQVFASFEAEPAKGGHPEFQLIREKRPDPDVLKFNHARHFSTEVVREGITLNCNDCHRPDPSGRFYQRVNFEANCKACHSLLFDVKNPELQIPHDTVKRVREFLRALEPQYAQLAASHGEAGNVKGFVARQMSQLRNQYQNGLELERAVFLEKNPYRPDQLSDLKTKAKFAGCAYCHDIKLADSAFNPGMTSPVLMDRWMPQANFNHAKHGSVDCKYCHAQAEKSIATADVLMPDKATCVSCHSPETKKVSSDCVTCHTYHAPGEPLKMEIRAEGGESSFKTMLLGSR